MDEATDRRGQAPMPAEGDLHRTGIGARLAEYRSVREEVERSVLPLATSVDGSTFSFQASLHGLELRRGGYVVLRTADGERLGQVTDVQMATVDLQESAAVGAGLLVRLAQGSGRVLDGDGTPFHDARVQVAEADRVGEWCERTRPPRAGLEIGQLLGASGVSATLDSGGFNRHTFMCGQSGSGKTYSLGLLLERLLSETSLRVVILDPNSDYVGLPHLRDGADQVLAQRYSGVPEQVAVWRNDRAAEHPLRLRFAEFDRATQASVLGLDPVADRDEYAVLTELLATQESGQTLIHGAEDLLSLGRPGARELGVRAANLGVLDWSIWAPEQRSLVEELRAPSARCLVVDLGSLDSAVEQQVIAQAVLGTLWEARRERIPTLVVIDEAHNVCAADPDDPIAARSSAQAVQIAAEGRKYGLYLLVSTQRPHKVHENVVSQCENLLLMRMNSRADLADLSRLFSFVPEGLMAGATSFGLGQALVAGRVMSQPAYVQMGERITEEGGADLPTSWATPRP